MLNQDMYKRLEASMAHRRLQALDYLIHQRGYVHVSGQSSLGIPHDFAKFADDFSEVWVDPLYLDGIPGTSWEPVVRPILEEIGFTGKISLV